MSVGLLSCAKRPLSWIGGGAEVSFVMIWMVIIVVFVDELKTELMALGDCASRLSSCFVKAGVASGLFCGPGFWVDV